MATFLKKYSVLLAYPAKLDSQRTLGSAGAFPATFWALVEAENLSVAIGAARAQALHKQAPSDRRGLTAKAFKSVLVLDGHHKPLDQA